MAVCDYLGFSTYQDVENFLSTQNCLALVVFVSRNRCYQDQVEALKYLLSKSDGRLPTFVLPGGYCDVERVKYNIAGYPTYLFLENGAEVMRFVGRVTGRMLADWWKCSTRLDRSASIAATAHPAGNKDDAFSSPAQGGEWAAKPPLQ